jgi:hypothetical protein
LRKQKIIVMLRKLLVPAWLLFMCACAGELPQNKEKSLEEIQQGNQNSISKIIRSPATASGPMDTVNVAKLEFVEPRFDFGEVFEGDVVSHKYAFTNTGKVPLLISDARSTCGCTVPVYPKEPIQPGEGGQIEVVFSTADKPGDQEKAVTITANTYPNQTRIFLAGHVIPKKK